MGATITTVKSRIEELELDNIQTSANDINFLETPDLLQSELIQNFQSAMNYQVSLFPNMGQADGKEIHEIGLAFAQSFPERFREKFDNVVQLLQSQVLALTTGPHLEINSYLKLFCKYFETLMTNAKGEAKIGTPQVPFKEDKRDVLEQCLEHLRMFKEFYIAGDERQLSEIMKTLQVDINGFKNITGPSVNYIAELTAEYLHFALSGRFGRVVPQVERQLQILLLLLVKKYRCQTAAFAVAHAFTTFQAITPGKATEQVRKEFNQAYRQLEMKQLTMIAKMLMQLTPEIDSVSRAMKVCDVITTVGISADHEPIAIPAGLPTVIIDLLEVVYANQGNHLNNALGLLERLDWAIKQPNVDINFDIKRALELSIYFCRTFDNTDLLDRLTNQLKLLQSHQTCTVNQLLDALQASTQDMTQDLLLKFTPHKYLYAFQQGDADEVLQVMRLALMYGQVLDDPLPSEASLQSYTMIQRAFLVYCASDENRAQDLLLYLDQLLSNAYASLEAAYSKQIELKRTILAQVFPETLYSLMGLPLTIEAISILTSSLDSMIQRLKGEGRFNLDNKAVLSRLEKACMYALAECTQRLIKGDFPMSKLDEVGIKMLRNPLLQFGIHDSFSDNQDRDIPLHLLDLCQTPELTRYQSNIEQLSPIKDPTQIPPSAATLPKYIERYLDPQSWTPKCIDIFRRYVDGSEDINKGWYLLREQSGISKITLELGGEVLDKAERALLATYSIMLGITETVDDILQNPCVVSSGLKIISKEICEIRHWASNQRQNQDSLSYEELANYIVEICKLILYSDFETGLRHLNIKNSLKELKRDILQHHLEVQGNQTNRWRNLKNVLNTVRTLQNLNIINTQSATQIELNEHFKHVSKWVKELYTESISTSYYQIIKYRRIKAVARAVGFMTVATFLKSQGSLNYHMVAAFSRGLHTESGKSHYWTGIQSADPYLLSVVQRSFFRVYNSLQQELNTLALKTRDADFYSYYSVVIEALVFPFDQFDYKMLLECQVINTINDLLLISRGIIGETGNLKYLDRSQFITSIQLTEKLGITNSWKYAKVDEEGNKKLYVEFICGESDKHPIAQAKITSRREEGWEVESELEFCGQNKVLLVKRTEEERGEYLTNIKIGFELVYKTYQQLIVAPTQHIRELFLNLRKCAWKAFKLLVLVSAGRPKLTKNPEGAVMQELLLDKLDQDLAWEEKYALVRRKKDNLEDMALGTAWHSDKLLNTGVQRNPMREWLRQLRDSTPSDFGVRHILEEYVQKYDPRMNGVISSDSIDQEKLAELLSMGDLCNSRGEFDFFRYLHFAMERATEISEDCAEFVLNSHLFKNIPEDFYEAQKEYNFREVATVLNVIRTRHLSNETPRSNEIMSLFDLSDIPGIVPQELSEGVDIPDNFKNVEGQLDLYTFLKSVKNQGESSEYYFELQSLFNRYRDFPESVLELGYFRAAAIESLGPLLLTLYNTLGSQIMVEALAKRTSNILKHMLMSSSFTASLLATRIAIKILPTYHNPQSIAEIWRELPLGYSSLPLSDIAKRSFVDCLFGIVGRREFWLEGGEVSFRDLEQWRYEALNLLRALALSDNWRGLILEAVIEHLNSFKQILQSNQQPLDVNIGAVNFLIADCEDTVYISHLDLPWAQVKLAGAPFAEGVIYSTQDRHYLIYSVVDDSFIMVESGNIQDFIFQEKSAFLERMEFDQAQALFHHLIDLVCATNHACFTFTQEPRFALSFGCFLKLTLLCSIRCMEKLSKYHNFDITNILNFLSTEIFPMISLRNFVFDPKMLTKLERVLIISMTELDKPNEADELLTDEEANSRIARMNEEDQLLAAELASFDLPLGKIIRAFELGIKDLDAFLNWMSGGMDQQAPLYSLNNDRENPLHFSKLNDVATYQNAYGKLVIQGNITEKVSLVRKMSNAIFSSVASLVEQITVLVKISANGDFCNFGFSLGTFEVGLVQDGQEAQLYVGGELRAMLQRQESYFVRVYAHNNGIVEVEIPNVIDQVTTFNHDAYCGGRVRSFGIWGCSGEKVTLEGFDIFSGKYTLNHEFNLPQFSSPYSVLTFPPSPIYYTPSFLELAGASISQSKDLIRNNSNIEEVMNTVIAHHSQNQYHDSNIMNLRPIVAVKLINSLAELEDGWEIPEMIFDGVTQEFQMSNKRLIAYKRHENMQNPEVYITSLSFGSELTNPIELGDMTIDSNIEGPLILFANQQTGQSDTAQPLRNIILVKSSKFNRLAINPGYQLATDSNNLVVNVLPHGGESVTIGFCNRVFVGGCPILLGKYDPSQGYQFGMMNSLGRHDIVQIPDNLFREKSVPEILELHQQQCEAGALESSGQLLFNLLKSSQDIMEFILSRPDYFQILTFLLSSKENVQVILEMLLSNYQNSQIIDKFFTYITLSLILGSFDINIDNFTSSLNSDILSIIKESTEASIEILEIIGNLPNLPSEFRCVLERRVILPLFTISQNFSVPTFKKQALYTLCKLLRGQEFPGLQQIMNVFSLQGRHEYQQRLAHGPGYQVAVSILTPLLELLTIYPQYLEAGWFDELKNVFEYMTAFQDKGISLLKIIFQYFGHKKLDNGHLVFELAQEIVPGEVQRIEFPDAKSIHITTLKNDNLTMDVYQNDKLSQPVKSKILNDPEPEDIQVAIGDMGFESHQITPEIDDGSNTILLHPQTPEEEGRISLKLPLINNVVKVQFKIEALPENGNVKFGMGGSTDENCMIFHSTGFIKYRDIEFMTNKALSSGDTVSLWYNDETRVCSYAINNQVNQRIQFEDFEQMENVRFLAILDEVETVVRLQKVLTHQIRVHQLVRRSFNIKDSQCFVKYPSNQVAFINSKWEPGISNCRYNMQTGCITVNTSKSTMCQVKNPIQENPAYTEILIHCASITRISPRLRSPVYKGEQASVDFGEITVQNGDKLGIMTSPLEKKVTIVHNNSIHKEQFVEKILDQHIAFEVKQSDITLQIVPQAELEQQGLPNFNISQAIYQPMPIRCEVAYAVNQIEDLDQIIRLFPEAAETKEQYLRFEKFLKSGQAEELIRFLDEVCMTRGFNELEVAEEQLMGDPRILLPYKKVQQLSMQDKIDIYNFIKEFNLKAQSQLNLFDLDIKPGQNLSYTQQLFLNNRGFIFFSIKNEMLQQILQATHTTHKGDITVDRPRAARHKDRGTVDVKGEFSIFGQIYRLTREWKPEQWRNNDRIFRVGYRGEGSVDAGGPYREVFSNMCEELQSDFLRLFVKTANQIHDMGDNRDAWIINPIANTEDDLELFLFLGKLMGVAIRSQMNLGITIAPMFWKKLLKEPVNSDDLRGIDEGTYNMLQVLRDLKGNYISPGNFHLAFTETFQALDSSGNPVELIPNGANIEVNYENAGEFADLLENMRLNESAQQYEMIWKGMSAVVPVDRLNLFTWKELEWLVCGSPDINVELLKQNTTYDGLSADELRVTLFWEFMEELTPKEKSLYLKFVWGRSKLPPGRNFKNMKIQPFHAHGNPDNYLPVAHTCFFTLDLPAYTNKNSLREKMLYAINNCKAIDLDGSASAGWEDQFDQKFQFIQKNGLQHQKLRKVSIN